MIILSLAGNIGVAAYGVVANTSLVAISLFNGIAQGSQPLVSQYYGKGEKKQVCSVLKMALVTALCLALILLLVVRTCAPAIASVFNKEHDPQLAAYAENGLRIYFVGFLSDILFICHPLRSTVMLSADHRCRSH